MQQDLEKDGFVDVSTMMHCVVYALVRKGVVVYIGQSKTPLQRIGTHLRAKKGGVRKVGFATKFPVGFTFDEVWVHPCMLNELHKHEVAMIQKYKPKYNIHHVPAPPSIDLQMLIEMLPVACLTPPKESQPQRASWRRL